MIESGFAALRAKSAFKAPLDGHDNKLTDTALAADAKIHDEGSVFDTGISQFVVEGVHRALNSTRRLTKIRTRMMYLRA